MAHIFWRKMGGPPSRLNEIKQRKRILYIHKYILTQNDNKNIFTTFYKTLFISKNKELTMIKYLVSFNDFA